MPVEIDKELRYAKIMENLSSVHWDEPNGVVKDIEINVDKLFIMPLSKSETQYLNDNWPADKIDTIRESLARSNFTLRDAYFFSQKKRDFLSEFDPLMLTSDDPLVVRECIEKYIKTWEFKYNFHKQGVKAKATDRDIEAISEFIQHGILKMMLRYQKVNKHDLEYVNEVYTELIQSTEPPFENLKDYFQTFFDTHFEAEGQTELTPLQVKWKVVLDWVVSEMPKEIYIKWIDYNDADEKGEDKESQQRYKLLDIKMIDIDMKVYSKIAKHSKSMYKFIMNYVDSMLAKKD